MGPGVAGSQGREDSGHRDRPRRAPPDASLYVGFFGSDFVEEGSKPRSGLSRDRARREGDVNVVELEGTVDWAPANRPQEGLRRSHRPEPAPEDHPLADGDFTRAKGKEVMEAFLKR